jgi:molybdopterin molybdotransferase
MPAVLHPRRPARQRAAETSLEQALELVLDAAAPLPAEPVELAEALGRALASDVTAERPLPPFDSSAMDGFAVRAVDLAAAGDDSGRGGPVAPTRLRVVGESRAGHPARLALREGEAVAISTGAMLPAGADAVVRVERTRREPDAGTVEVLEAVARGADVRRSGEDVAAGAVALRRGERIGPAQLGLLAALGRAEPLCAQRPRMALLTTGDELRDPGEDAGRPGSVVDANGWTLAALARAEGARVLRRERVGDDREATRAAIVAAAADADLLVLCGGVSVGAHDHVRPCLAELGARESFWGLALKPGHPTWHGTLGERRVPVLGLPGNPVSAMVVFLLLGAPALRAMQGRPIRERPTARLDGGWRKPPGRAHAVRCTLSAREDGWHARPTGPQGSHVLSSMAAADALAVVPAETTELPDAARVRIEPLARCW